jgi:uncharacterized protein YcbK (DUF882 family)
MERGSPLFPEVPQRHRIHGGLRTERQEHIFTWMTVIVVLLYATMWISAAIETHRLRKEAAAAGVPPPESAVAPTENITGRFFGPAPPKTPYLNEALLEFLDPLRGESGEVRYAPVLPGEEVAAGAPGGSKVVTPGETRSDFTAPERSGIYDLVVELNKVSSAIEDLSIVTLVPIAKKNRGSIGSYQLGSWPWESGGAPRSERYAAPRGFIEVTRENQDFYVSEHFRLRDFLTKGQQNVWPKYLVLDPLLIDKLELTIQELERQGVKVKRVHVMSGFRTPQYNHSGGNVAGRANLSRHMYGDAADVYVDNNGDNFPDDITGDGRVTIADAEKFAAAADAVEKRHRALVGGIGVYAACCGHGPFTHIDVRGIRARWRGTGNG